MRGRQTSEVSATRDLHLGMARPTPCPDPGRVWRMHLQHPPRRPVVADMPVPPRADHEQSSLRMAPFPIAPCASSSAWPAFVAQHQRQRRRPRSGLHGNYTAKRRRCSARAPSVCVKPARCSAVCAKWGPVAWSGGAGTSRNRAAGPGGRGTLFEVFAGAGITRLAGGFASATGRCRWRGPRRQTRRWKRNDLGGYRCRSTHSEHTPRQRQQSTVRINALQAPVPRLAGSMGVKTMCD